MFVVDVVLELSLSREIEGGRLRVLIEDDWVLALSVCVAELIEDVWVAFRNVGHDDSRSHYL